MRRAPPCPTRCRRCWDDPLPEHYRRSRLFLNPLHVRDRGSSPVVSYPQFGAQKALGAAAQFPFILTTGFLHEMWGGGAMSRRTPTGPDAARAVRRPGEPLAQARHRRGRSGEVRTARGRS
ncbi:MAG: hypothetical protein U1E76_15515 [Planctomycetota bacterium]